MAIELKAKANICGVNMEKPLFSIIISSFKNKLLIQTKIKNKQIIIEENNDDLSLEILKAIDNILKGRLTKTIDIKLD